MRIDVVTLFPEFVLGAAQVGVVGRAQERRLLEVAAWNPRDYTNDKHRTVDDRPFGGGPGMVMLAEPLRQAVRAAQAAGTAPGRVIGLSPQGERLTQRKVRALALEPRLLLLCGRYEGIDERFIAGCVDEELSIGDFVLSGGELAAAVLIDAIGRLREGALGNAASAAQDSFEEGLLDCPHYTRPERDGAEAVPAVLLSGDHAAIRRWRLKQSLGRTWLRRPDLLARLQLDKERRALLDEFITEWRQQKL
ncbi:MAG TPA: tRNA (guanosine(37)-N1)-methyltransferase TrmD [Pseudomonadota bacterium]|nr:tRNA (guanosine(37)-N1)-methyltransferase TrmD [Xanthomonadales bacterium]HQW63255.1 tRNA (guanosine(37)-N1)-methyltransferase TrmD [Pseudomonadota bacterium]MBP7417909.1 tRNA (guanosine(37)-N1)-methyltransferase TrmD [Xanthomonadales bacterium]HQX23762.1 tRNA (guanosine(37)-N1)-methyltransferase TrmD [Pseudomonadota bacterium]HQY35250.1 tRNA (guanosine(37)-N1)-methyltransferase TrmD [Pseudomonadota bacterium]